VADRRTERSSAIAAGEEGTVQTKSETPPPAGPSAFARGMHTAGWLLIVAAGARGCGTGFLVGAHSDYPPVAWFGTVGGSLADAAPWAAGIFAAGWFLTLLARRWAPGREEGAA
jgi:hypothetical protein